MANRRPGDPEWHVVRLSCPTGCSGTIPRPHALRAQPVRCSNCRAWLAAPTQAEDGSLVCGLLLARPGEGLPAPRARRQRRWVWWLAAAAVAVLMATLLVGAGRAQKRRSDVPSRSTSVSPRR